MARINSKVIFVTTSPRTPAKMIPEIELLNTHFAGQKWNIATQRAFMEVLKDENFFNGKGKNDPAWSARDRITRAPKALGFVSLSPTISITQAGIELVTSKRKDEIFLRQLLKFQVPSPFHKPTDKAAEFWVKPYLELFRLIRHFGSLKFDELRLFGLQLTDYRNFDNIVAKIDQFRIEKAQNQGNYKKFYKGYLQSELRQIFSDRIQSGETKTRETKDASISTFLLEKMDEVDYFLEHTDREPCFVDSEKFYLEYLGNAELPILLSDNRELLVNKIQTEFPNIAIDDSFSLKELKNILADELDSRKEKYINDQVIAIKDYRLFEDINTTFDQIIDKSLYDTPLMLEWNTWRAMTMMNGGNIKANLKFDDFGNPMSTAQGNMADIICDYGDFRLAVEVTMQGGQRQYETEGEPVTRHLAKVKKDTNKPAYCLFIAPNINDSCIAHFYALHKMNISYYGGTSTIIPLPLNVFRKMMEDSYNANYVPKPKHVQEFFEHSNELANSTNSEIEWYNGITQKALNWLSE